MVVNDTGNADDSNLNDGTCRTSNGRCTLRAAISQANNNVGPDTIHFNIPGNGVHTIELNGDELPAINDLSGGLTIDGYTQPGATPNTDPLTFNADIRIEIDGGRNEHSFVIQAPENTFRGLSAYNSKHSFYFVNENADGNVVVGNIIGSNHDTTFEARAGIGLSLIHI